MTVFPVEPGRIVISRAGRDRGRALVVLSLEDGEFARVADGDLRKIESPKRKRIRHLRPTPVKLELSDRSEAGAPKLLDADLRKALAAAGYDRPSPTSGEEG